MARELRHLARDFGIYGAGQVLQGGIKLVLVPVYMRMLSVAQFGELGIANAISAILSLLVMVGMDRALARDYFEYKDDPAQLADYLRTVGVFLLGVNLLVAVAYLPVGAALSGFLAERLHIAFFPLLALCLLSATTSCLYAIMMVLLQVRQEPGRFITAQSARLVLMGGAAILLMSKGFGAASVLIGESLGGGVVALALLAGTGAGPGVRSRFALSIDRPKLRRSLAYALPFIGFEACIWVMIGADRLILGRFASLDQVGLYSLAVTVAGAMHLAVASMYTAVVPFFFSGSKTERDQAAFAERTAAACAVLLGGLCLPGMLFAKEILRLAAPARYLAAEEATRFLLVGSMFRGLFYALSLPLKQERQTSILTLITGACALGSLAVNLALIPSFGIHGAAWANILSFGALAVGTRHYTRTRMGIELDPVVFWGAVLIVPAAGLMFSGWPLFFRLALMGIIVGTGFVRLKAAWRPQEIPVVPTADIFI